MRGATGLRRGRGNSSSVLQAPDTPNDGLFSLPSSTHDTTSTGIVARHSDGPRAARGDPRGRGEVPIRAVVSHVERRLLQRCEVLLYAVQRHLQEIRCEDSAAVQLRQRCSIPMPEAGFPRHVANRTLTESFGASIWSNHLPLHSTYSIRNSPPRI